MILWTVHDVDYIQLIWYIYIHCSYIDESGRIIPYEARISLISQILSGRFTLNALNTFLHNVHTNTPIPEALLHAGLTYTHLGLQTDRRQAGLRQYDHGQLFSLAFMQRACGYSHGDYFEYKPYIEGEVDEQFRLVGISYRISYIFDVIRLLLSISFVWLTFAENLQFVFFINFTI